MAYDDNVFGQPPAPVRPVTPPITTNVSEAPRRVIPMQGPLERAITPQPQFFAPPRPAVAAPPPPVQQPATAPQPIAQQPSADSVMQSISLPTAGAPVAPPAQPPAQQVVPPVQQVAQAAQPPVQPGPIGAPTGPTTQVFGGNQPGPEGRAATGFGPSERARESGYAANPPVGTASYGDQGRYYTQPDLDRMGGKTAVQDPNVFNQQVNLAGIKAEYAGMMAQRRTDEMANIAHRDQAMREHLDYLKNYKGGRNLFEDAQREQTARITERSREVFGTGSFGTRRAGTSPEERAAVDRAGAANAPPSTRDFFKEAKTTQDMVLEARKGVGAEKTTGLEREGKAAEVEKTKAETGAKLAETKRTGLDTEGKAEDVKVKQDMAKLRAKIEATEPGPAKEALLKQYYAYEAKVAPGPKFPMAHIATGPADQFGNRTIEIVPVHPDTGEYMWPKGHPNHPDSAGAQGAAKTPTAEAIAALKANPQRKAEFDAYYGAGAAARAGVK